MEHWKNLNIEDIEGEKWIDAIGFDGIYEVSNLGRIKSLGRLVPNGRGERLVRERIKKQTLVKEGRLTCPFNVGGESYSQNIQALVFLSFNTKIGYNPKRQCVMHLDKIKSNNVLTNLIIKDISESHLLNAKKGLLPHLKKNNEIKKAIYDAIEFKYCTECGIKKEIKKFERGRNKCKECRKIEKNIRYRNSLKK